MQVNETITQDDYARFIAIKWESYEKAHKLQRDSLVQIDWCELKLVLQHLVEVLDYQEQYFNSPQLNDFTETTEDVGTYNPLPREDNDY